MWPEPWEPAKSPSLCSALSPSATKKPSPPASRYTMAASLLKFHVIGCRAWSFVLPQCPGSGACCRGDTLCKLRAGKPFLLSLTSEKGRKVPPHSKLIFSISPSLLRGLVSKLEKRCSTKEIWLVGLSKRLWGKKLIFLNNWLNNQATYPNPIL